MGRFRRLSIGIVLICMFWAPLAIGAEITVRFTSPVTGGDIIFQLFDSPNTFGDFRDPVLCRIVAADGCSEMTLTDVSPGEYAFMVFHDRNSNGDLDKNFIGIPVEALGFSGGYRPKGPPVFNRAKFTLSENGTVRFDVTLYQPLGKRGRIGVGPGIIARSSPYRDYHGNRFQGMPAVTFIGKRFQIMGPRIQVGLARWQKLSVAAGLQYRMGVYEEDESSWLQGMGDRKDTLMLGLNVKYKLPGGIDTRLGYTYDVLDRIGGGAAGFTIDKSFQLGIFRLSPGIGLRWFSSRISNHDFGVPREDATSFRPEYQLDDTLNVVIGLGTFIEITRNFMVIMNFNAEFLDEDIRNSPIVSENYVINGFMAVNYVF